MQVLPLTDNCLKVFQQKDHICFGISLFNSLFSVEYLESLVTYAQTHFKNFHFFLPDEPTIYTLEALGYGPAEARKKMKKQNNWLKNKIVKALISKNLDPAQHILDWDSLQANPIFIDELNLVSQKFETCEEFRAICLESSKWVLQNKLDSDQMSEECLLKAVKYFLAEIPVFAATSKILARDNSLFCYHQSIHFHEQLYQNLLVYKPFQGQGFGKIIMGDLTLI